MSCLEIDSVNFAYGSTKILSNIHLQVDQGEVVGMLGRNGCGKSTFLKILFGTLRGEGQSVRVDGQYYPKFYESGRVGFLTQDALFPTYLRPTDGMELMSTDPQIISQFPLLEENLKKQFYNLSTGTAKFLETLIMLYSNREFLLLDEPFSYVAPVHIEQLLNLIPEVAKTKGIVLTDHRYKEILQVSDRLYFLSGQSMYRIDSEEDLKTFGYIS